MLERFWQNSITAEHTCAFHLDLFGGKRFVLCHIPDLTGCDINDLEKKRKTLSDVGWALASETFTPSTLFFYVRVYNWTCWCFHSNHLSSFTLGSHLENLLQLLVVLHHDDVGFAIVCHILAGFRRVGGVDTHSKATVRRKQQAKINCD